MSPIFFKYNQIDKSRWDQCVKQHTGNNFICFSWYLDAVCNNWDALIVGDYEYILPIPSKSKGFFKIAYQPFFSRHMDVIGAEVTPEIRQMFFSSVPKKYMQFSLAISSTEMPKVPGFRIEKHPFQALNLGTPYEDLRKDFSENASRILNKLSKQHFTYSEIGPEEVIRLFTAETAEKIENLTQTHINHLKKLLLAAEKHQLGYALGAFNEQNELQAAGFFIQFNQVVFYLKGASTADGRKNGAMYGIMNEVIKRNADSDKYLDFGGSRIDNIARFFKKFGASDRYYTFLKKDPGFLIHLSKQLYHKLKR